MEKGLFLGGLPVMGHSYIMLKTQRNDSGLSPIKNVEIAQSKLYSYA